MIIADDLGYGDLSVYGQTKFTTPNLDRMAREGMRFTQAYSGSTVCAPSRAVLMTGLHTGHAHIRGNGEYPLRPQDVTIAEVLKRAGYRTGVIGKWGLGLADNTGRPDRQGFDESFGFLHHIHAHRQYTDHLWRNGERVAVDPERDYANDLFTAEAVNFLNRNKQQPFFLYLAYTNPHAELRVPEDSLAEFRGKFLETPFVNRQLDERSPTSPWRYRGYRSQPTPRAAFAAMVTRMDRDIGRLLAHLKEQGVDDNTIVFFTSDNGPHKEGGADPEFFNSNGELRGIKRDLYEGGIRVPFIARWPGQVKAGTVNPHQLAFWDMLPTFAELAGARAPAKLDGISQRATLMNQKQKSHDYLYWEFFEGGFTQAVRMGDWKGVKLPRKSVELYDLQSDPGERQDIAAENPQIATRIARIMTTARSESKLWPAEAMPSAKP
ncbi:MAG: arylsulfatase [Pyrinomonadaceae bacterium]